MAIQKPSIPKGTRDFLPEEMAKRAFIFDTIRSIFNLYGYVAIETPAMENLSTLLGKYGEEGDKLLFKILNSGDYLGAVDQTILTARDSTKLTGHIAEKGLRYDLTVPFARFVVQYRTDLTFPFKRYQMQPVWRADRPQRGRYREFYQCDVDIIGSTSLMNEAELLMIIDDVFQRFGIRIVIKLNNRKILAGIAEIIGYPDRLADITVAVDKIDKIGLENVNRELAERGLSQQAIDRLQPILCLQGDNEQKLQTLREITASSTIGQTGIEELQTLLDLSQKAGLIASIEFDLTLARGLNYYTGPIIEVKALEAQMGSICGGGRYDDLTGIFGLCGVSGVGVSFGVERIYDILNELNLFPAELLSSATKVLLVNFGPTEAAACLPVAKQLRSAGISTEIYPEPAKMKKQFSFADTKKIQFAILIGQEEMNQGLVTVKNMKTGEQSSMTLLHAIDSIKSLS
ncbi:MAG: histidine--tRNA ligase [Chitinivibrionales bacterium]|nr:histidine--tRNA ligase [Chitinivibrionales bacterium]